MREGASTRDGTVHADSGCRREAEHRSADGAAPV